MNKRLKKIIIINKSVLVACSSKDTVPIVGCERGLLDCHTALHCAAESGQAEVMELLVKKGADVEARTNKGVTALQIAESLHYIGITRILIQGGATKDNMMKYLVSSNASIIKFFTFSQDCLHDKLLLIFT